MSQRGDRQAAPSNHHNYQGGRGKPLSGDLIGRFCTGALLVKIRAITPVGAVHHNRTLCTRRSWKQRLPNMGSENVYLFLESTIKDKAATIIPISRQEIIQWQIRRLPKSKQ